MERYAKLFEYFRSCPYLSDLMSIASESEAGSKVILPQGASPFRQYRESRDVLGGYEGEIVPYPSVYEDFQINCYVTYDVNDTRNPLQNINAKTYDEVVKICKWVQEQDKIENFPDIGEKIVSIETNPFVPQVRYVDPENDVVCYFITVRIRYVNPVFETKTIVFEGD